MGSNVWLRQAQVLVWDTTESATVKGAPSAWQFMSDGTLNTIALRFTVNRSIVNVATETQIVLYNLSPNTRRALQKPNLRVALQVGWSQPAPGAMHTIFIGALLRAVSQRYGADILTTLRCWTGADALNSIVIDKPVSYGGGTLVSIAVLALAKMLQPSVLVDPARVKLGPDTLPNSAEKFSSGGRALAGSVREAIDKLADEYHFSWSIQNGTFQALDDRTVFGGQVVGISAANGTLISAVPILVSAMQLERGVEVKALMIPDLMPGDQMQLTSVIDSSLNGLYKMHEIEYAGSPNEREWLMTIRSYTYDMV